MSQYDLESVKLPRLSGALLKLFTALLENNLTRPLLIGTFLKNAGITGFQSLHYHDAPTLLPLLPVSDNNPTPPPDTSSVPDNNPVPGFAFSTVSDYARAYRSGQLSPVDVAERALNAIARSESADPPLRALIAVDLNDVMAQASESAERFTAGAPLSVLDGVPVAVKDEVDMVPYGTTVGTRFLGKTPAQADSTVVARLREAGAILLGKANMHEIGISTNGLNPHHGTPRNPYHTGHYPGGSSSGPGVTVGAGLCPVAVGADGGGSIRIPASYCGVVGLKATFGRVSEHGAAPLAWTVGHLGPLAATVTDAALAYAIMAGPDPADPQSLHQPPVTIDGYDRGDISGLTIGVYPDWFNHAAPDIVAACQRMLDHLQAQGAAVKEIVIPELDAIRVAHTVTILTEMALNMDPYTAQHQKDFDYNTRILLTIARQLTARDYTRAQQVRTRAMNDVQDILQDVDMIATPATAITAPPIPPDALPDGESDASTTIESMRFMFLANMTGHPAIVFPVGYDSQGLPVSLQLIGRAWEEHTLLRTAYVGERLIERQKPKVYARLLGE